MKSIRWERKTIYRNAAFGLALLTIALIVHEVFGEHGWLALRRQQKEVQILEDQIQQLQRDNQQLEIEIKALKSDPKAIEKQAREQLRLARPGELIFVLPNKPPKGETAPTAHE